jgi:hypothetical protein
VLIDRFMPRYDVVERHRIDVDAPAGRTFERIRRVDLRRSLAIRTMFAARGLSLLFGPRRAGRPLTLEDFVRWGFVLLGDEPGEELVLGGVVRPFSGLIRREMLRLLKADAEGRP